MSPKLTAAATATSKVEEIAMTSAVAITRTAPTAKVMSGKQLVEATTGRTSATRPRSAGMNGEIVTPRISQ